MLWMFSFIFARKGAVTTYIHYVRLIIHMYLMVHAGSLALYGQRETVSIEEYQITQHNTTEN